jgi:DNA-binding FadR family transcriptional regulator
MTSRTSRIVFEPIKSRRLSEMVENHIKDIILLKKLMPGERLPTEKEISAQLSVSPVTVREALRALETIGMIEKKKGNRGGVFVSQVNIDLLKVPLYAYLNTKNIDYEHIYQTRKILEPAIIRLVLPSLTEDEFQALALNVSECEAIIRKGKNGLSDAKADELKQRNIDFHRLLAEPTRNPVFIFTLEYIIDFIYVFRKADYVCDYDFLIQSTREHRSILARIKERDAERAEKELISHLETVLNYQRKKYG